MSKRQGGPTIDDLLIDRLDRIEVKLDEKLESHEKRLDEIEHKITRSQGWIAGVVAVVTIILSTIATVMKLK